MSRCGSGCEYDVSFSCLSISVYRKSLITAWRYRSARLRAVERRQSYLTAYTTLVPVPQDFGDYCYDWTDCDDDPFNDQLCCCGNSCRSESGASAGFVIAVAFFAFIVPMAGIFHCIQRHRLMGQEPQPMAWFGCIVIFLFSGPCLMWIPFALDSCYSAPAGYPEPTVQLHTQPQYGQPQQQPMPIMAEAVPVQAQPVIAQATAVNMNSVPMATATATATATASGQQPPVATVTAVSQMR